MYEVDQYTVSLLHFEDGLKDECGKVWSFGGGAKIVTSQKKSGTSSLLLDKSQKSYISTPDSSDFDFGYKDFTIELNVFFKSIPTGTTGIPENFSVFCSKRYNYDSNGQFNFYHYAQQIHYDDGTSIASNWQPEVGCWYHIAIVKKDKLAMLFLDGKLLSSQVTTIPMQHSVENLIIGATNLQGNPDYFFDGYIDEFRISNIARWTSDFDPNPKVARALLVVTMSDEIQKEYDLSMDEINNFIIWYDNRSAGNGLPHYTFNKDFNLGPFQSRKDYLVFDKIQNFEVMEY